MRIRRILWSLGWTGCIRIATAVLILLLSNTLGHANPVSARDVVTAVRTWLAMDNHPLGANLSGGVKRVETYNDGQGNPLYYVVYLAPSGYVIVSADDFIEPIVAFSPEDTYDPSPANPLCNLVTRDLASRMRMMRDESRGNGNGDHTDKSEHGRRLARGKWNRLLGRSFTEVEGVLGGTGSVSDLRVPPLVQTKWSQTNECGTACYNYYTPPYAEGSAGNYPSGCVATSMAQVMRYWQHPTAGIGVTTNEISICGSATTRSTRGGNGSGGPYSWASMPLDPGCATTLNQRKAIGALCNDAGVAVGMDYCSDGSGISDLTRITAAMKSVFMYSDARLALNDYLQLPSDTCNRAINSNLHADMPTMLAILGTYGGHVVVCDGYGYNASTMYHHLNMGWAGASDAWYNLPNITSSPPFDSVVGVLYNMYVTGSGEIIAGRVTDANGVPIPGATVVAGPASDVTDSRGLYALTGLASDTTYDVTVSKSGYLFSPRSVTTGTSIDGTTSCGNLIDIDFSAQFGSILVSSTAVNVGEGSTSTFGVKLSTAPPGDVTVSVSKLSGDPDITVLAGATLSFSPANWDTYQNVTLAAAEDTGASNGVAIIRCSANGWGITDVTATEDDNDRIILSSVNAVTVPEGSTATFGVKLAGQPSETVIVTTSRVSGDTDISVQSGSSLEFNASNWNIYQTVTLAAANDGDATNGTATIRSSSPGWTSKDVLATEFDSQGAPDTQPPSVPTGLTGRATSQTSVSLSWTASTDNVAVAGYRIYRDSVQIGTSATPSYVDTTCTANTTYSYSVSAFDGAGNASSQCSAVRISTPPYIEIIIDEESASYLDVWADGTSGTGEAWNDDYKYTDSASIETHWTKWTPSIARAGLYAIYVQYMQGTQNTTKAPYTVYHSGGVETFEVDQTRNGGQWVYLTTQTFAAGSSGYVKLGNATGETGRTVVADAVRFYYLGDPPGADVDAPSVPTGLSAAPINAMRVNLSWTASTDNVQVAGYRVFRNGIQIGTSAVASYSDATCSPSTTYSYAVSAYDTSGNESAKCTPVNATTPSSDSIVVDEDGATLTGAWADGVFLLEQAYNHDYKFAMTSSSETATITWTPNVPGPGNYAVYVWYTAGENRSTRAPYTICFSGGTQTYEVDQTQNGGLWRFLATKPFQAGTSGYVKLSNFTGETSKVIIGDAVRLVYMGPLPNPPSTPADGTPTADSTTSITWRWLDVSGETGYRVKDTSGTNKSGDLAAGTVQWTEQGLTPNTLYSRRVYAFNSYGESGGSMGQSRYTLAKAGIDPDGTGTLGNVWCTNASANAWYGPGKTFVFSNPAGFGTGGEWKASRFEYKWNKSDAETWLTPGTSWSGGSISLSPSSGDGYYYLHVRAFNGDDMGNNAQVANYGPFKFDSTPPTMVSVEDEGNWTPSLTTLSAWWTASSDGDGSGVHHYEYAIGTSDNRQDVKGWTPVGTDTSVTASGLSLQEGQQYFFQVRAVDNVGNISQPAVSSGITVAPGVERISQAWTRVNLIEGLSIRNKVVTGRTGGAFWLEETDRSAAIKVISQALVSPGDVVSVAGVLGPDGTQRSLIADVVVDSGTKQAVPVPLLMPTRDLGGADYNPATPGVTGGSSLYNIGLLVRCAGRVTYSDTSDPDNKFFYLDDGSGLSSGGHTGVRVRCGTVTPPTSGMAVVTGLVTSEQFGDRVVPVLLALDIQTP